MFNRHRQCRNYRRRCRRRLLLQGLFTVRNGPVRMFQGYDVRLAAGRSMIRLGMIGPVVDLAVGPESRRRHVARRVVVRRHRHHHWRGAHEIAAFALRWEARRLSANGVRPVRFRHCRLGVVLLLLERLPQGPLDRQLVPIRLAEVGGRSTQPDLLGRLGHLGRRRRPRFHCRARCRSRHAGPRRQSTWD